MKRLFLLTLFVILGLAGTARAELPMAQDLAALGEKARMEGKPIVVFFYQEQCHYCETVRHQFLLPISRNEKYQRRIILRQVNTRAQGILTDFQGNDLSQLRFAKQEGKAFTPTVAFYGPDGERLSKPLVGLKGGRDYYGYYLDQKIQEAEAALEAGHLQGSNQGGS